MPLNVFGRPIGRLVWIQNAIPRSMSSGRRYRRKSAERVIVPIGLMQFSESASRRGVRPLVLLRTIQQERKRLKAVSAELAILI